MDIRFYLSSFVVANFLKNLANFLVNPNDKIIENFLGRLSQYSLNRACTKCILNMKIRNCLTGTEQCHTRQKTR